jgi:hypothetical protein
MTAMQLIDMFPNRYLRGQDMTKPMLIEMHVVLQTALRSGPDKPEEKAFILYFDDVSSGQPKPVRGLMSHSNGKHALVLRRALAEEIMAATGTTDTDEWGNKRVVLYHEARVVARRNVVSIRARAAKPAAAAQQSTDAGGGK